MESHNCCFRTQKMQDSNRADSDHFWTLKLGLSLPIAHIRAFKHNGRMDIPAPLKSTYFIQVASTVVVTAIFVLAIDAVGYRGLANALGMFLPPLAIAILSNRSWDRRAFMIMALIGVSMLTAMFVGVNFTSYG
ncbi:MAG: hypothetical protein ACO1NM_01735 [Sphingobium phenoxybenzoativorans]